MRKEGDWIKFSHNKFHSLNSINTVQNKYRANIFCCPLFLNFKLIHSEIVSVLTRFQTVWHFCEINSVKSTLQFCTYHDWFNVQNCKGLLKLLKKLLKFHRIACHIKLFQTTKLDQCSFVFLFDGMDIK